MDTRTQLSPPIGGDTAAMTKLAKLGGTTLVELLAEAWDTGYATCATTQCAHCHTCIPDPTRTNNPYSKQPGGSGS